MLMYNQTIISFKVKGLPVAEIIKNQITYCLNLNKIKTPGFIIETNNYYNTYIRTKNEAKSQEEVEAINYEFKLGLETYFAKVLLKSDDINAKIIAGDYLKLDETEFNRFKAKYGKNHINDCINEMYN